MITYRDAGVDVEQAGKVLSSFAAYQRTRPRDSNVLSGIGPFASCYSLLPVLTGMKEPLLATSCDGVGTKGMLALKWNRITTLGQDLVAMNVNDLLCVGAKPLLFLDYYACGNLDAQQLTALLVSIQSACELAGCSLVGGETAEMPGLYRDRDFDLAGFSVGVVDRANMLGAHRVGTEARLVALASSGFHSNGYSLVRKLIDSEKISPDAQALGCSKTWRDLLLAPTVIYSNVFERVSSKLMAAAHITGGGLFENLARILPPQTRAVVHEARWPIPQLFQWVKSVANLSTQSLLSTFNCGVGMILVVAPEHLNTVLEATAQLGVRAWDIGYVEASPAGEDPVVLWV